VYTCQESSSGGPQGRDTPQYTSSILCSSAACVCITAEDTCAGYPRGVVADGAGLMAEWVGATEMGSRVGSSMFCGVSLNMWVMGVCVEEVR